MHRQLWQGIDVPTLLVPTALKKGEGTSEEQGFFVESTLPTSLLLSAISAQITQGRSGSQFRFGASRVLFELLRKLVRTSYMKVQFESQGNSFSIAIPTNGLFPSATLLSMVGVDVVRKTRQLWDEAVQDKFWQTWHKQFCLVSNGSISFEIILSNQCQSVRTVRRLGYLVHGEISLTGHPLWSSRLMWTLPANFRLFFHVCLCHAFTLSTKY